MEDCPSAMQCWLRQQSRYPLLSDKEQRKMALLAKTDEKAAWDLVNHNLRLIFSVVAKAVRFSDDLFPDLLSECAIKLFELIREGYNPNKNAFSTYATVAFKRLIQRKKAVARARLSMGENSALELQSLSYAYDWLRFRVGIKEPTDQDLLDFGLSPEQVAKFRDGYVKIVPLHTKKWGDQGRVEIHETIDNGDEPTIDQVGSRQDRKVLEDALDVLNDDQWRVVYYDSGMLDGSYHQSPDVRRAVRGVSRERVRQLEVQGLNVLRSPSKDLRIKRMRHHFGYKPDEEIVCTNSIKENY